MVDGVGVDVPVADVVDFLFVFDESSGLFSRVCFGGAAVGVVWFDVVGFVGDYDWFWEDHVSETGVGF